MIIQVFFYNNREGSEKKSYDTNPVGGGGLKLK